MQTQDFLKDAISSFEAATHAFVRSENEDSGGKASVYRGVAQHWSEDAKLLAILSIASDLRRIADRLDLMSESGSDANGDPQAALRTYPLG